MPDNHQYEFFLLRYAPDAIKDEFVNIGLVLLGTGKDAAYTKVRMSRDWRRVLCMDADADLVLLDAFGRDLESQLANVSSRANLLKRMEESFSGAIQLSPVQACRTHQPDEQLEVLAKLYLESRRAPAEREYTGRQRIVRIMQDAFERAGVWRLMKLKIPAADYVPGDPLKIDCGYNPNGTLKMFHAVPLTTGVDLAKILAFTYPMIAEAMSKKHIAAELTAIVDTLDRTHTNVAFALQTLEASRIAVAHTGEMPAIAERARLELRA